MKTPQELNKIYDRLPKEKVKLNATRVELGIADDIQKAIAANKAALGEVKAILSAFDAAKKAYLKVESEAVKAREAGRKKADNFVKLEQKTDALLTKAESAAKGLGVKRESINGFSELENIMLDLEEESSKILDFDFDLGGR